MSFILLNSYIYHKKIVTKVNLVFYLCFILYNDKKILLKLHISLQKLYKFNKKIWIFTTMKTLNLFLKILQ